MLNLIHLSQFLFLLLFKLLLHVDILEYPIEVLLLERIDLGSLILHGLTVSKWEEGNSFVKSLLILNVTQIKLLTYEIAICWNKIKLFLQFVSFHIELVSNHFVSEITDFFAFFHYFVDLIVEIAISSLIPLALNLINVFMSSLLHKIVLLCISFSHASLNICFKMWIVYTSALRRHRILPLVILLLNIWLFVELWQVIDCKLDIISLFEFAFKYVIRICNVFRLCSIPIENVTLCYGEPDLLEISLAAIIGHGRLDTSYGAKESTPNRHLVTTITRHNGRCTIKDRHWIISDFIPRSILIGFEVTVWFEWELTTLE